MKYLFTAREDKVKKTEHKQDKDDASKIDPTKSAFYDVMNKKMKHFRIEGENHSYLVDLKDGHFEVDGVPIWMHDKSEGLKDFRLVYFRRHTHSFSGRLEDKHEVEFCIGWQTNDKDGKNVQQILRIQ